MVYASTGKFGDIINSLSILKAEYDATGIKPVVITSARFATIFEGVSYCNLDILSTPWGDLHSAIRHGKEKYGEVVILQAHGDKFPFQQTKSSFQLEVYDRAGCLDKWDTLYPVFDRRDFKREKELVKKHVNRTSAKGRPFEKYILFGDKSESSQFPKSDELYAMLLLELGATHKVIKLSTVKAERIYDLIGLYDKADALITTETVHTHLAQASSVPKFVLSADGWRGSAFRKSLKFYMKYAEWPTRSKQMIQAIKETISIKKPMDIIEYPTLFKNGYNQSVINFDGGIIGTYRYHENGWQTKLAIRMNGVEGHLYVDPSIEKYSIEDARLFLLDGKPHAIYTVSTQVEKQFRCYQAYGEISKDGKISHIQIKHSGNDFTTLQKNWCPFVIDGKLYVIYGIQGANQTVLQIQGDKVSATYSTPAPKWEYGEIRGGVILPRGDTLLRFFHSRADRPDKTFRYYVGCLIMENKAPFKTLQICKAPILQGDEEYFHDCKHYKPNVKICYGAIQSGDKIMLSCGVNDSRCRRYELREENLNL